MQTGSTRALRLVAWGAQVLPRSVVVAIAREPPRLSRMFSISVPVRVSTTAASVVLGLAVVPRDQVSPWSFDHSTVERGSRRSAGDSWYCAGNTRVPSSIVMPRPGPCRRKHHSSCFTWRVMLIGSDQVTPSSSERTSTSWPVCSGSNPGPERFQPRLPWCQLATIQIVPVVRSTRIAGSPTPSWAKAGSLPMSMTTRASSQEVPPSVLRERATSMCPGRSPQPR